MNTLIRYVCLWLGLLIFPFATWAQDVLPNSLLEQAQRNFQKRQYDSAVYLAEQALAIYEDTPQRAQAYYEMGRSQRRLDQLSSSTNNLTNAIRLTRDSILKAKSYYELGKSFSDQVQPEAAINHYEQALLFKPDTLDLIRVYEGIADEHNYYFGNYQEAERFYEQALRNLLSMANVDQALRLRLLYNLAAVHQQRRDNYAALDYAQQATQIAKETQSINLELCYSLLGTIYHELQQYSAAIAAYQQAIEQGITSGGELNPGLNRYYNNLGLLYFAQGHFSEAILQYQQAQIIALQGDYPRAKADQADSYHYLGNTYTALQMFAAAHRYLSRALELKQQFYGNDHPEVARTLEGLSHYYQEQNLFDSALNYQQQALIAEIPGFSTMSVSSNPNWHQLQDYSRSFNSLNKKAELLYQRFLDSGQQSDLRLAISTFVLADSLINLHRISYEYESSQLQLLDGQKSAYEIALASCYLIYETTQDEEYIRQALYFMERSKAVILHDVLRDVSTRSNLGVSDSLQQAERAIKAQLTRIINEMNEARSQPDTPSSVLDSLQDKRFELHRRQSQLQETLAASYPNYVQLRYASSDIPWNLIQQRIREDKQYVIEYFWGENYVYALGLTPTNITFYRVPVSAQLTQSVRRLHRLLGQSPSSEYYEQETAEYLTLAYQVYRELVAPVLPQKIPHPSSVTFIPDGLLSYLPFEALLTEEVAVTEQPDYRDFPYLLSQFAVQYSPSLQVLYNFQKSPPAGNAFLRLLAFGFTDQLTHTASTQPLDLVALPGTFKEIKAIGRLTSAQLLAGSEASETHFKNHAENYQILHLALHGLADSTNANNNVLFFPAAADSVNDGKLHSFELYDLQLNKTKLAVLSACETGTGRWEAGEGVYSMGRGFAYAGCPSVIMSLWKVNDAFTARIMPPFYQSLLKGNRIDYSLRKAKLQFIRKANRYQAHPSYWAAFVLQGDLSPIVQYRDTYLAGMLILFISLGYALLALRKKKAG